jgi:drug/metabolite transporter (DMT)-like permease
LTVLTAYTALLFLTVVWGLTFPLVQIALKDVSPALFLTLRFLIAAAAMLIVFLKRVFPANGRDLVKGIVIGCFLWGGYISQTFGLQLTAASRAGFLTGTLVPLTPLFAFLLFGERFSLRLWMAVFIAFSGIFVMSQPSIGGFQLGDGLVLIGAACFALQIVYINRWSRKESLIALAWIQLVTSAVLSALAVPFGAIRFHPTLLVFEALLITAIFASALAVWVQMTYQPRLPAAATSVIFAMEPVFAGLAAWLFLAEVPPLPTLIGAVLIISGMILSSLKIERRGNT